MNATETRPFEDLKNEITTKAKAHDACASEYRKVLQSSTEAELLKVISDNLAWCLDRKIVSHDFFKGFTLEAYLASGIANSGEENSGYRNSGDRNSGDRNSGDSNSGYWNSGDRNSGDSNSGDRNSGDSNSGDSNSGDSNSGNWNSGDRNSGDSNSGYRNSGAFCTDRDPVLMLFNKPCKMTVREWENHKAVELMLSIDPTIWVPASAMSDAEKAANPKWETTEGYLKTIPIKEAWANAWHNWSEKNKKVFLTLPNFDSAIFEEITGIKV